MATYRDAIILSPSVDINKYLPKVSYLQNGVNRSYRNFASADSSQVANLDFYLLDTREYQWWAFPQNVYSPFVFHPPTFANGLGETIPYGASAASPTNQYIRSGQDSRRLTLQLITVKVWLEQYQNAINWYTGEIARIIKLEAKYKKQFTLPMTRPFQTPEYVNTRILDVYNECKQAFEEDKLRLEAIQYDLEQRIVYYSANGTLAGFPFTPGYLTYYSGLSYTLYPASFAVPIRQASIPRSFIQPFSTFHHFLLPGKVTGIPFWSVNEENYLEDQRLVAALTLRLGNVSAFQSGHEKYYRLGSYYSPEPMKWAGRNILLNSGLSLEANTGREWYKHDYEGQIIPNDLEPALSHSIVPGNKKLDLAARVEPYIDYYGATPRSLKSKDGAYPVSETTNLYFPFYNPPGSVEHPFFNVNPGRFDYPLPTIVNQYDARFEYAETNACGNFQRFAINRHSPNTKPWNELFGKYADQQFPIDSFDRLPMPGWEPPTLASTNVYGVLNDADDSIWYKRSALFEYLNPASLEDWRYIYHFEPPTDYYPEKIWFGGTQDRPISYAPVRIRVEATTGLPDYTVYRKIEIDQSVPSWLNAPSTLGNDVNYSSPQINWIRIVDRSFVGTTYIEKYGWTAVYTDPSMIPRRLDIFVYQVTFDITQAV